MDLLIIRYIHTQHKKYNATPQNQIAPKRFIKFDCIGNHMILNLNSWWPFGQPLMCFVISFKYSRSRSRFLSLPLSLSLEYMLMPTKWYCTASSINALIPSTPRHVRSISLVLWFFEICISIIWITLTSEIIISTISKMKKKIILTSFWFVIERCLLMNEN